nr:hypothetical protein [Tanacetum cinerariifolium]
HDANRSSNGDNSNDSVTGGRRQMSTLRECTYTDFLNCQPMSFQGTKGVVGQTRWRRTSRVTPAATTTPTTTVTNAQLQALIDRGVAAALDERDAERSRNGDNNNDSGTGGRRQTTTPRECSYTDFLKCQPMNFQGTEGVVGLVRWAEKMESVFQISNCTVACQVKFASCTLQGSALTWWNSHMMAIGQDVAYAMPWAALKRMITSKYCPRGEIQKLESEFWNLKVKEHDADRSSNGDNSNDSVTGGRRQMSTLRECTYTDFLNCQPMSFQGTKGVVGQTRWLEKMESVF